LSDKKPLFADLKSFLITVAVIIVVVVVGLLAIDRNNVNRLKKYHREALELQQTVRKQIDERFRWSIALAQRLDEEGIDGSTLLFSITEAWGDDLSMGEVSKLYLALDHQLGLLQRELYRYTDSNRWAPYFEKIWEAEVALIEPLEEYNSAVAFYNAQRGGFPALLAARRLGLEDLPLCAIGEALKGRP
jgi:hypothetical protein